MMNPIKISVIAIAAFFTACNSDDDKIQKLSEEQLVVSTGTICGWCTGADSLNITAEGIHYETISQCEQPAIRVDKSIDQQTWDELKETINWDDFQSINLNTCNYCADGCDTWILIKNNDVSHRISYGTSDSLAVAKIKPLIDKLDAIKLQVTHRSILTNNQPQ